MMMNKNTNTNTNKNKNSLIIQSSEATCARGSKFAMVIADEIEPKKRAKDYMDRAACENEIKQLIGSITLAEVRGRMRCMIYDFRYQIYYIRSMISYTIYHTYYM